jgi:ankyrin repeat protein
MTLTDAINAGDVEAVRRLLESDPELATKTIEWSAGGRPNRSDPLHYVSDAAFHGLADHDRFGEIAKLLIDAGAPVDGTPDATETPLIGAASLGRADVAKVLVDAGADTTARGHAVPGGALAHAVNFGMTDVVDVLVEAGAPVDSIVDAAGVGDVSPFLAGEVPEAERRAALRAAAVNDRTAAIDQLLDTGVDVNAEVEGATPLHWAAWEGRAAAARKLLERGADPDAREADHGMTPQEWASFRREHRGGGADQAAVEGVLAEA